MTQKYGATVDVFDDLIADAAFDLEAFVGQVLSRKLEDMGATPHPDSLAWQRFDEAYELDDGSTFEAHGRRYRMVGWN